VVPPGSTPDLKHRFSLSFVSPDSTERWHNDFFSLHITDITQRSGAVKPLSIFWQMLYAAGLQQSTAVSLEVVISSAFLEPLAIVSDDKIYIVLTHAFEFDRVRYPLRLLRTDFTLEEHRATIRRLYLENMQLKESPRAVNAREPVGRLQLTAEQLINQIAKLVAAKNAEIKCLEQKLYQLADALDLAKRMNDAKPSQVRTTRKIARTPK
jgi:hypothetical protein